MKVALVAIYSNDSKSAALRRARLVRSLVERVRKAGGTHISLPRMRLRAAYLAGVPRVFVNQRRIFLANDVEQYYNCSQRETVCRIISDDYWKITHAQLPERHLLIAAAKMAAWWIDCKQGLQVSACISVLFDGSYIGWGLFIEEAILLHRKCVGRLEKCKTKWVPSDPGGRKKCSPGRGDCTFKYMFKSVYVHWPCAVLFASYTCQNAPYFDQWSSICVGACVFHAMHWLCAVKMSHLLSATCQDTPSFGGGVVCVHVYCVCVCVDSVLSRCLIFCQLPAKMPHLSAGGVVCVHVYYVCVCWLCAVKMSHLLSVTCQDAPSFGRWSYMFAYMFACMCITMYVHVHMHWLCCQDILSATCQAAPSLASWVMCVCVHVYCLYMLMISILL